MDYLIVAIACFLAGYFWPRLWPWIKSKLPSSGPGDPA